MLRFLILFSFAQATIAVQCYNGCLNVDNCPAQTSPCSDNYCFYTKTVHLDYPERTTTIHGCRSEPFIEIEQGFPPYTLINTCSSITVDGIAYKIKICNNSDYCSSICDNPTPYDPSYSTTTFPWYQTTTSGSTSVAVFLPLLILSLV